MKFKSLVLSFCNICQFLNHSNIQAPTITGPNEITISYHENKNQKWLINQFTIEDNHTSYEDLIIYFDNIPAFNEIGKYSIEISAKDEDNNVSKFPFILNIIDRKPPEIKGNKNLQFSIYNSLSYEEIVSMYHVEDEIDGECYKYVSRENYRGNERIVGEYYITFIGEDSSNNRALKTIDISIIESEPYIWYIDNVSIETTCDNFLNKNDILNKLIENNYIQNIGFSHIEYLSGDYESFYNTEGVYNVNIRIIPSNSIYYWIDISLTITVLPSQIKEIQKKNFFDILLDYLKEIIKKIKNFLH